MTAFKFPPPPPPPSKTSASDAQQSYTGQRGGFSRGRNDRDSGRGGHQGQRGRSQSYGGNARGGHGQDNPRGHLHGRSGYRRHSPQHRGGGHQTGGPTLGIPPSNPSTIQPHVNPALLNQPRWGGQLQSQVDSNALAQAMSFMATPAGQQSMAAFANHMAGLGNVALQETPASPPQGTQPTTRYSPTQHAGQKRKLNDRISHVQPQPQPARKPPQERLKPPQSKPAQQSSKPRRVKADVPPPVPSFGFSLPLPPALCPSTAPNGRNKHGQKRKNVNLGLTHHPLPEESSEEEEDIDEEAAFAAKLKGGGFVFEHEGEQITIRNAAEVSAWVKDRRKNFPTQKRIAEKAHDATVKRVAELNFLRKVDGRPLKASSKPQANREKSEDEQRRQDKLAALRKSLHESMLQKQATPVAVNFGLGYSTETESDDDSSVLSESSVVSSSEDSSEESDVELDESDAAPETASSKAGPPPIKVPPPPPPQTALQSKPATGTICQEWAKHGRCSWSSKCKFTHPPSRREEKRMGLFEVMVEQELVKTDQFALDAIKYLGQHGFLG